MKYTDKMSEVCKECDAGVVGNADEGYHFISSIQNLKGVA